MKVTEELVDHIAHLSRLEYKTKEEKQAIMKDLERMIGFVDKLNELPTDNIEPLIYMNEDINHWREDEIGQHTPQKEALANAPKKDSDYFRVPKVINK
jgi:aspartyl-tRNA(Asn)/glutamyl-tRNA(Gln) amidotransferase subunit C